MCGVVWCGVVCFVKYDCIAFDVCKNFFADILKDTIASYNESDENSFKTIVAFDCRGVEPTDFSPRVSIMSAFCECFFLVRHQQTQIQIHMDLQISHFVLQTGWSIEAAESGAKFEEVNLQEKVRVKRRSRFAKEGSFALT